MGITGTGKELTAEERLGMASEENKRLRAEIESLSKQLKNAGDLVDRLEHLATLSETASEIAHEINNPVNFVAGSLNIVKRGVGDFIELMDLYRQLEGFEGQPLYKKLKDLEDDINVNLTKKEIWDATATIEKGMERIHEIAHNLSLLGKREAATPTFIDVNSSIADTLLLIQDKVKARITIKTELGTLPAIKSYKGKLNQVFTNIIKNAVEAIHAKPHPGNDLIHIKTTGDNDTVVISIRDTGIGMSEQTREKLFEKFYTTKSSGKGSGLGMGVCKAIIDKHQGSIEVLSEKGKGTEVIIRLPVKH